MRAAETFAAGGDGRVAEPTDAPCRGPGRLTRHLGVGRDDNGRDVCPTAATVAATGTATGAARMWIEPGTPPGRLAVSARIGVDYAGAWAAAPLRFYDPDSRAVSRRRRTGTGDAAPSL